LKVGHNGRRCQFEISNKVFDSKQKTLSFQKRKCSNPGWGPLCRVGGLGFDFIFIPSARQQTICNGNRLGGELDVGTMFCSGSQHNVPPGFFSFSQALCANNYIPQRHCNAILRFNNLR
jgi:hypothetical protein